MLLHSYVIWNNKGGVGKSTITYHLACRFAELNPAKKVLIIDLCPQGNSSMLFLGGGDKGESKLLGYCNIAAPRTVVGYISTVITNGMSATLPDPNDFLINVNQENEQLPGNIYLLCGDGNLESMAPAINIYASQLPLVLSSQPWKWVQSIFKKFISNLTQGSDEWMVFIDTSSSFSIYTQMAVSSTERIIVPINADNLSKMAVKSIITLLHGNSIIHPVYGDLTYSALAKAQGISIPQIHLIVGNKLTRYESPTPIYTAMTDTIAESLYDVFNRDPQYFTGRQFPINDVEKFKENFSLPLHDFGTVGIASTHFGRMLSDMSPGYYRVHNSNVKIDSDMIKKCTKGIDDIISQINYTKRGDN